MPELPEVEIVCRGLRRLVGAKIDKIVINQHNLRYKIQQDFTERLENTTILAIDRCGKYIKITTSSEDLLIIHLGMTGKLFITETLSQAKHDHVIFILNNHMNLVYNDVRRFGLMMVTSQEELNYNRLFNNMGVEPFSDEFNRRYLSERLMNKNSPIKTNIMDNSIVLGVGNIYASESLFSAKISPLRKGKELDHQEIDNLIKSIRMTLSLAIEAGGSTISDYVNSEGKSGYFQHQFQVYNRTNQKCYTCNCYIKKITISGRSSFYCPSCQL